jgi:ribose transport system ATP-binding protein
MGRPLAAPAPRLSLGNASKTFGRATVLDDVCIDVARGEIHGLVGQNGSGKSTLIKLLSGYYSPDPGMKLEVDGESIAFPLRPRDLAAHGIAFVHQNLGLDATASVIENIRIGRFTAGKITRRINWRAEATSVAETLATLGATGVDPYALVGTLSHAERASVAIARAIQGINPGEGCIVFDESTQSLPRDVLRDFYRQVRDLAASGTSVLIVSHRLDEILALCDRVTVLEDGRATIENRGTAGLTEAELGRLILGTSASGRELASGDLGVARTPPGDVVLSVEGLRGGPLRGVDLEVRYGEVVGVIGDDDSGYDALPAYLSGSKSARSGSVTIAGESVPGARMTPARAMARGLCLVPSDRLGEGLATGLVALDNLSLPRLTRGHSPFFLRRGWQLEEFRRSVGELGLTPADPFLHVSSFSGGNQQKLLLSKWLENSPKVLVLHEPTQAVDVGARVDILTTLRRRAADGSAILISSMETQDLATVCDRILVLRDGMVVRELTGDELEPSTILEAVYPGDTAQNPIEKSVYVPA